MAYYWEQKATYWARQLQRESGRGHSVCLQGLKLKITFEIRTPPLSHFSPFLPHFILVCFSLPATFSLYYFLSTQFPCLTIYFYDISFCPHLLFSVLHTLLFPVVLRPAGRRVAGQGWTIQKILFDDREGSFCSLILLFALTHFKPK